MVKKAKGRRLSSVARQIPELPGDAFAGTKLDYAFNLVTAGVLRPGKHRLADVAIILALLGATRTSGKRKLSEETVATRLRRLVAQAGRGSREPRAPGEPIAGNVGTVTRMLGLDETSQRILEFALACCDSDIRELLDPIACPTRRELTMAVAAATAQAVGDVERALSSKGRLQKSGLLTLHNQDEIYDRLELDHRLVDLLGGERLLAEAVMERFLPAAQPPTLEPEDYGHLGQALVMARQLLATALAQGRAGTNLLIVGPTGTGKTELARLLAQQLGVPLFVTGREDEDGDSPTTYERLRSFLLGNRLLAAARALLVFDEMEDLFACDTRTRRGHDGRMSKQWFNHVLETNAVPTIWIANDIRSVDPAFLRRFTFAIEVGASTAGQRRRAWRKHLGAENHLPAQDLERLVARFEVSPAQIGNAVSAARLAVLGGRVTAPVLEAVLEPSEWIVRGRRQPPRDWHPGPYLPEVLNTPVNLEALAERLRIWNKERTGRAAGVSLCLYGPPGTGKSAYVAYLARRLDRALLIRRPSDLLSPYVGETEQNLAQAFDQAYRDRVLLLLDEVDTFLQDRRQAVRSWEVSQVNEFLQQLENFPGIVACTTNLFRGLDQACLRRFSFKIGFDYLRPEQAERLLQATLERLRVGVDSASVSGWAAEIDRAVAEVRRVARLTPGDFAAVARRWQVTKDEPSPLGFVAELREETRVKGAAPSRIGFGG